MSAELDFVLDLCAWEDHVERIDGAVERASEFDSAGFGVAVAVAPGPDAADE